MAPMIEEIGINIAASLLYDVGVLFSSRLRRRVTQRQRKMEKAEEKEKIVKYVFENMPSEYRALNESSVINQCVRLPQVKDIIGDYTEYAALGKDAKTRSTAGLALVKDEYRPEDVAEYINQIIQEYTKKNDMLISFPAATIRAYFLHVLSLMAQFFYESLPEEDRRALILISHRVTGESEKIITRLDIIEDFLRRQTVIPLAYDKTFDQTRESYMRILSDRYQKAWAYQLDEYDFASFYVPPTLYQKSQEQYRRGFKQFSYGLYDTELFDKLAVDWRHIFNKENIVYITGDAGYGKSFFTQNVMLNYASMSILDAASYLVVRGELKSLDLDRQPPMSIKEYLQACMIRATGQDAHEISLGFISYYLEKGRCLLLLDALDEVPKKKREDIHKTVVSFFREQNPHNKIVITSRHRGFLPVSDEPVFEIGSLTMPDITKYLENMKTLKRFTSTDLTEFERQVKPLVDSGFVKSFLVLSLLVSIFRTERKLPDNKVALYEKCLDSITKNRELEKSIRQYDMMLLGKFLCKNTFMLLAQLCYPNNREVSGEEVKEMLIEQYQDLYTDRAKVIETVDVFLSFCAERTELFVPRSENHYNFFHRSFFEYYYALSLTKTCKTPTQIYEKVKHFDIDSEVPELVTAILKDEDRKRYIAFVKKATEMAQKELEKERVSVKPINLLSLTLQAVDDAGLTQEAVKMLIEHPEKIRRLSSEMVKQGLLAGICCESPKTREAVAKAYRQSALHDILLYIYQELYWGMKRRLHHSSGDTKAAQTQDISIHELIRDMIEKRSLKFYFSLFKQNFYMTVYLKQYGFGEMQKLSEDETLSIIQKEKVPHYLSEGIQNSIKEFYTLSTELQKAFWEKMNETAREELKNIEPDFDLIVRRRVQKNFLIEVEMD